MFVAIDLIVFALCVWPNGRSLFLVTL